MSTMVDSASSFIIWYTLHLHPYIFIVYVIERHIYTHICERAPTPDEPYYTNKHNNDLLCEYILYVKYD